MLSKLFLTVAVPFSMAVIVEFLDGAIEKTGAAIETPLYGIENLRTFKE